MFSETHPSVSIKSLLIKKNPFEVKSFYLSPFECQVEFTTASPAWHPSLEAFVLPFWCLPQCVCGDGHNALGALLRSKTRCKLQCLIRQGSQVEAWLIGVTKPGTAWHGQHLGKTESTFIRPGNGGKLTSCNRNGCTAPNSFPLQQLNSCGCAPPSSEHTWGDTPYFQLSLEIAHGMERNFKTLSRQQILQLRYTKTITCKSPVDQYCPISFF